MTGTGLALLATLALTGGLAGCAGTPPPEASGSYPDISESPTEPPPVPSASERAEVVEGLRADRRENRYADSGGERRRSSEVRPPEFSPPTQAPAETSLAERIDAGESPVVASAPSTPPPADSSLARTELPPPVGAERGAPVTVPAGTPTPGAFQPSSPYDQASAVPSQALLPPPQTAPGTGFPAELPPPPMPSPYGGGPIVVDSRGVTTTGAGGTVTSTGPYPVAANYPGAGGVMVGPPGAQPLSTYGPMGGARSQRVAVVYFGDGSSGLSGQDIQVLGQVAALQRQYGGVVRVIGHASSRTGATTITRHKLANFNVSLARANNVAEALMRAGVPGRFLYVGAASDSQPVYYEIMPTGEAGNRRTEIYLDY